MKNKYSRPTLELSHWLVNCEDLERICTFFHKRLRGKEIDDPLIEVEVESGNHKEYRCFKDFLKDIQQLISVNEEIEEINCYQSAGNMWPPNECKKAVRIRIDFKYDCTSFCTSGDDDDGSVKDWVAETHEALQQLVDSFKHDESLTKLIQKKYAKDYRNSAIVLDYDGSILEQLTNVAKKSLPKETQETLPQGAHQVRESKESHGKEVASHNQKDSILTDIMNETIGNNISSKQKRPWFENPWLILIVGGLIVVIIGNKIFGKNDEKSTNVTSFNQQGGIIAGQVNIGKQERHFSEATKASLIPYLPKDKGRLIDLAAAIGDEEARQFADEIKQFLEGEGYNVSFGLVVWKKPFIGGQIIPSEDGVIKIRIGRHK